MSKPVRIHNARFGRFPVACECGRKLVFSLTKGNNRRTTVCSYCKAIIRVEMLYDGYGVATVKQLTIEQLEDEHACKK